jgi:hypothetical protein
MIILNMKDGLGNQLFEYAYGRWMQEQYGEKLVLNNFFFDGKKRRSYSLHRFQLNPEVRVPGRFAQFFMTLLFVLRLFLCYPRRLLKWLTSKERPRGESVFEAAGKKGMYVSFEPFVMLPFARTNRKIKFIYGNYESAQYFPGMEDALREELRIFCPPSGDNARLLREIESCEAVCVHVRRGDYLTPHWSMLNVCTFQYFRDAMRFMASTVSDPVFYVFSNGPEDIAWIRANYAFEYPVRYVDLGNPDYEELRLMSACKHFIISNSSFSWWAAFLSDNSDKQVAADGNIVSSQLSVGSCQGK